MEAADYKNGFLNGLFKSYDEEGNLRAEAVYEKDNITGDKITYHKNGTIAMISPYKNGKSHGLTKKYSETGQLQEEWLFEDGQLKSKKDFTLNENTKH